ncbi:hypothetical protein J6590_034034 [Homalodisca vitripennis]|nr:hypothetical protein J6590_034034 [Homalodisca vitripennis]
MTKEVSSTSDRQTDRRTDGKQLSYCDTRQLSTLRAVPTNNIPVFQNSFDALDFYLLCVMFHTRVQGIVSYLSLIAFHHSENFSNFRRTQTLTFHSLGTILFPPGHRRFPQGRANLGVDRVRGQSQCETITCGALGYVQRAARLSAQLYSVCSDRLTTADTAARARPAHTPAHLSSVTPLALPAQPGSRKPNVASSGANTSLRVGGASHAGPAPAPPRTLLSPSTRLFSTSFKPPASRTTALRKCSTVFLPFPRDYAFHRPTPAPVHVNSSAQPGCASQQLSTPSGRPVIYDAFLRSAARAQQSPAAPRYKRGAGRGHAITVLDLYKKTKNLLRRST